MTPEFFNGASTYRMSMDRHGMNLAMSNGGKFGNTLAESNDRPSDVSEAINGDPECRIGAGIEENWKQSGTGLKGYGR
jgi:hypothetical protein